MYVNIYIFINPQKIVLILHIRNRNNSNTNSEPQPTPKCITSDII